MSSDQVSAFALFTLFAPRFRTITWDPIGFTHQEHRTRFYFKRADAGGYRSYSQPYFDFKESGLSLTFRYDPLKDTGPLEQFKEAAWQAIQKGPFAERTFFMDPSNTDAQTFFRKIVEKKRPPTISVMIKHDGDEIPGLHLDARLESDYLNFFIPQNSKEHSAIEAALALETYAHKMETQQRRAVSLSMLQHTLRKRLDTVVPA